MARGHTGAMRPAQAPQSPLREPIIQPRPRAQLLASSVLTGGTWRSLAVAAGMMTAFGISPALAQCFSGAGTNLGAAGCQSTAPAGAASPPVRPRADPPRPSPTAPPQRA